MDQEGLPQGGLITACRRLLHTAVALLGTRLELFALEFQEEKQRLAVVVICAGLAVGFAWMTMTFFTLTLVYLFWESARLAVLLIFTLVYLVLTLSVLLVLWSRLKKGKPFASTLEELKKDKECLQPRK